MIFTKKILKFLAIYLLVALGILVLALFISCRTENWCLIKQFLFRLSAIFLVVPIFVVFYHIIYYSMEMLKQGISELYVRIVGKAQNTKEEAKKH